ncbi:MAG: ABC transporter substrate binding protein [bacterium]
MRRRGVPLCTGLALTTLLSLAAGGCRGATSAPVRVGLARVAVLVPSPDAVSAEALEGLRAGLAAAGLRDRQDFVWQEVRDVPAADAPLPMLILAPSAGALTAALRAAAPIPVVFTDVADPEAAGARPPTLLRRWLPWWSTSVGADVSGVSGVADMQALLESAAPLLAEHPVGVVFAPADGESAAWHARLLSAASRAARPVESEPLRAPDAGLDAVRRLCGRGVGAVVVLGDPVSSAAFPTLLAGARACGVPLLGTRREHAAGGAVVKQALDARGAGRAAGERAAQALRGDDIGALGFAAQGGGVLIVNTQAAERDGLGLPLTLIERADDVIGD